MIKPGGRGKAFESLIVYSFNQAGDSYVLRLRESIKSAVCHKCKSFINLSNKARKQPFDYFVVHKGRALAIEAKSVHGVSFPMRNIKDHQIEELQRFAKSAKAAGSAKAGGSYVMIEFIPGKRRPRECYLVPIGDFMYLMDFYSAPDNERKSIPMKKLHEMSEEGKAWKVEYRKTDKKKTVLALTEILDQEVESLWSNK